MKYIAAAFCFLFWAIATSIATMTVIGLIILIVADGDLREWWFKTIPLSILDVFKK